MRCEPYRLVFTQSTSTGETMSHKNCRHAPNSGCCNDEIKNRKCPARLNGHVCTGRSGAIGADESKAIEQLALHPERRKQTASSQVPLERRRGYRYAVAQQASQTVSV